MRILFVCFSLLIFCSNSYSQYGQALPQDNAPRPTVLDSVGIDQKMGDQIPLDLTFQNEAGKTVRLNSFFEDQPIILVPSYYKCPMLCTQILNGLVSALRPLSLSAGSDFQIVTFSFNPDEKSDLAAAKKSVYVDGYGRDGSADGWHFLTGDAQNIKHLTDAIGYRFAHEPETDEYIHASGIMILTPNGKLARYLFGVEYAPRDIQLGLIEASQEKIGTPIDAVLLFCFQYNPLTGKYSLAIYRLVQVAGVMTVLGIVALLVIISRKNKRRELQHSIL